MEQYRVTGMSCAACQTRVEKAVSAVPGVESCAVSLLTNSMGVTGSASKEAIMKAVSDAGYGAIPKGQQKEEALTDTETPKMRRRLVASLLLLVPLMYVSMGHSMWGWPVPPFLQKNPVGTGLYELLLSGLVMVINQKFFINGAKGLWHKSPNMDTLVALGSMASFVYSVYVLFAMTAMHHPGEGHDFYFESAAMILTLITVGKLLEAKSKGRTTDALKALMKLAPKTAILWKNGVETEVPVEEVAIGDVFVVRPGSRIPVDGEVIEGFSAVNEATFTGESVPVEKEVGDSVSAATMNTNGYMKCRATRIGEDTALAKVIQMVSDAAATKAPIAKIADRVSGVFVPVVIAIAVITFVVWMMLGQTLGFSLARAISVLVISCPCALGLATPVAIMVGNGVGAIHGVLFKTAVALEQTGDVQIVALDKTGTITTGQMQVEQMIPGEGFSEEELLWIAASMEVKSEHPISHAITEAAAGRGLLLLPVTDFQAFAGNGLTAMVDEEWVFGGNKEFIAERAGISEEKMKSIASRVAMDGKTPVFFAKKGVFLGMIAVADAVKPDSEKAIHQLKKMGVRPVMLTGDNETTARAIASEVGITEVIAGVKPDGKEAVIRSLMEHGRVAMVGDGINDAPALTRADVGIAIGAGTDIAMDAADVVLTKSSLLDVAAAIRISRRTIRNIHENLFWAFFYNVIGIPLAAGCYIAAFGWTLNPMFGAAAMSLSSVCVVSNALRLNWLKPYDDTRDKRLKNALTEALFIEKNQEKMEGVTSMNITVTGMMCPHCEAHVKEALEKLDGVTEAVANHQENLVTLTTTGEVAESEIKAAVEGAGYQYGGMR
ncbi:Cu2+-exporting ATPase [Lachnospiraceae bacterium XBB1006]|nr:Cu2+-exporting ATPase [Lachnospiraceae bacterium XBB1006]